MKILMIHNYYQFRGGEDIIVEQEVSMLRERGVNVEVLSFNNEDFFNSTLQRKIQQSIQTIYNFSSVKLVEDKIASFKPDVVHIHNLFYKASPGIIHAIKRRGVPIIMTMHNYRLVCSGGMLMREAELNCERCISKKFPLDGIINKCFRGSRLQTAQLTLTTALHKAIGTWQSLDKLIVLTEFARSKILQTSLQLHPEQVAVKPNAIYDLGYAEPKNRETFFLFLGRLSTEKGIHSLLDAARQYVFPLKIAGDGPLRGEVEKAAKDLSHVQYLGLQPRESIIALLKQCRALILPSIWYEGLPTTLLEAFATGTPVICSDNENLRSIVGQSGKFFKANNYHSLLEAIQNLQTSMNMAEECKKSRLLFEQNYLPSIVVEQQIAIYSSLKNNITLEDKCQLSN